MSSFADHLERFRSAESLSESFKTPPVNGPVLYREPQKRKRLKSGKCVWKLGKKKAMIRDTNLSESSRQDQVFEEANTDADNRMKNEFLRIDFSLHRSSPSLSRLGSKAYRSPELIDCKSKNQFSSVFTANVNQGGLGDHFEPANSDKFAPLQMAAKKTVKATDNKMNAKSKRLFSLFSSSWCREFPEISGNRRVDKIRWSSVRHLRFANTKDAETMTELMEFFEPSFDTENYYQEKDENFLKKCPKTTNLNFGRKRTKEIQVKDVSNEDWRGASKKCRYPDSELSDSSKSLTYLFQSKSWFFDADSDCEENHENPIFYRSAIPV